MGSLSASYLLLLTGVIRRFYFKTLFSVLDYFSSLIKVGHLVFISTLDFLSEVLGPPPSSRPRDVYWRYNDMLSDSLPEKVRY